MTAPQEPLKWRKKPVVVEAIQWTGNNTGAVMEWAGERRNPDTGKLELTFVPLAYPRPKLWVAANNAWVEVEPGEWFIRDARGVYPCKPDIFEATYEPADTPERNDDAELRAAADQAHDAIVGVLAYQHHVLSNPNKVALNRAANHLRAALAATEGQP